MPFKQIFDSVTTENEKQSDLYKLLSQVGVLTEKAIYEAIDAEIRNSVEPLAFTVARLQSWLAFLLKEVPNRRAAHGRAVMHTNPDHAGFSLPSGSPIMATNGLPYTLETDLVVTGGLDSTEFAFYQGTPGSFTSVYGEYLAIPVEGIDITQNFRVLLPDGGEVPKCHQVKYGHLPSVDDELPLERRLALQQMVTRGYIRPENGYFAFYMGDTLYIKIYQGFPNVQAPDEFFTPNPEGLNITVEYIACDGLGGVLRGSDHLTVFEAAVTDSFGNPVEYTLAHPQITNGYDAPLRFQLVALLREYFFARQNVATIPEYEAFLRAQPEVGDVKVMGDFERWVGGRNEFRGTTTSLVPVEIRDADGAIVEVRWEEQVLTVGTAYTVTGIADVLLISLEGSPVDAANPVWTGFIDAIEDRLRQVRDLAQIQYSTPLPVEFYAEVEFISATDPGGFVVAAIDTVARFFNHLYVWGELGDSLFDDLDLTPVREHLGGQYKPSGLNVSFYHFFRLFFPGTSSSATFPHFDAEESGGWYEFFRYSASTDRMERIAKFREFDLPNNDVTQIYWLCEVSPRPIWFRVGVRQGGQISIATPFFAGLTPGWDPAGGGGVLWGNFPLVPVEPFRTGSGFQGAFVDDGSPPPPGEDGSLGSVRPGELELRCYWRLADRGVARIGHWRGYRRLSEPSVGGGVRVRQVR